MASKLFLAKVLIFGTRRARISDIQRQFNIGYNSASQLIEELEANKLIEPINEQGRRFINWHHPDWLDIAKQPQLWTRHVLAALEGEYYSRQERGEWLSIHEVYGKERVLARFDTEEAADDYQLRRLCQYKYDEAL